MKQLKLLLVLLLLSSCKSDINLVPTDEYLVSIQTKDVVCNPDTIFYGNKLSSNNLLKFEVVKHPFYDKQILGRYHYYTLYAKIYSDSSKTKWTQTMIADSISAYKILKYKRMRHYPKYYHKK